MVSEIIADKLELIPVKDLLGKNFFIPSYQRGYRWEERQVLDLLEDLLEFQEKEEKEKGEFYCLQPIVVTKREDDSWEVIDGQQRLTTIYILLAYLKDIIKSDFESTEKFSISYETREKKEYSSKKFLEEILHIDKVNTKNIDFYHMSQAFLLIKNWFKEKLKSFRFSKSDFVNILLKVKYKEGKDTANNVRFIWYEVKTGNGQEPIDLFTRLNMGKIPLTNAELIKALFFINDNSTNKEREKHQQKLAYEWDNIEKSLQNKDFWFFLNKSNDSKPIKIEFIFDLIADKYQKDAPIEINKTIDKYYTFYIFNSLINNGIKTKEELWEEVKTYFRIFEEWFNDNEYYHLIGYLIHAGEKIENNINLSNKANSKSEFKKEIKEKIKDEFKNIETLKDLSYLDDSQIIKKILLLFNVVTTMNSNYTRFPFERYVNEKWSLEHIHAQNSEGLKTDKQRRSLLEEQKRYFEKYKEKEGRLLEKIEDILEQNEINLDKFDELQKEIFKKFTKGDSEVIHSIDNLALLSTDNNSALNNNIFPIKRYKIIELDKEGKFIPICTKNVFLKYYSKDVIDNSTWTQKDRNAYLEEIEKKLKDYLPNKKF